MKNQTKISIMLILSIIFIFISSMLFLTAHFLNTLILYINIDNIVYFFDKLANLSFLMDVSLYLAITLILTSVILILCSLFNIKFNNKKYC